MCWIADEKQSRVFDKVLVPIIGQCPFSDSWGKDSEVQKKTSPSQIQLILSIAALILCLAINCYLDPCRVSCGKSARFVFYQEMVPVLHLKILSALKKTWKNDSKLESETFDLWWSENQTPCCIPRAFWAYVLAVNRCKVKLLYWVTNTWCRTAAEIPYKLK